MIHAGFIPQNRPARPRRTGINSQNSNPHPKRGQHGAKAFNECGFAHARRPRQPDAQRAALRFGNLFDQLHRAGAMIGPRTFDQGNGPRQGAAIPVDQICGHFVDVMHGFGSFPQSCQVTRLTGWAFLTLFKVETSNVQFCNVVRE